MHSAKGTLSWWRSQYSKPARSRDNHPCSTSCFGYSKRISLNFYSQNIDNHTIGLRTRFKKLPKQQRTCHFACHSHFSSFILKLVASTIRYLLACQHTPDTYRHSELGQRHVAQHRPRLSGRQQPVNQLAPTTLLEV